MPKFHKEAVDRFFDYDVHPESRTIYLGDASEDGVDHMMSERLIKALLLLQTADAEKPIKIILNSFGGCWYNGMAIYDAIKACPCHVTIEVYGAAMSMGSIILQAADERVMHPNAALMVHDGTESIHDRSPKTFQNWAKEAAKNCDTMYAIYAEHSAKKDPKFWEKKCQSDFILSAPEAKELGLIDKIAGEEDQEDGE